MSTWTRPARAPARIPFGPSATSSVSAESPSMVKTTSLREATSAAEPPSLAPRATSASMPGRLRFQTASSCPASRRWPAMGRPIIPKPMKPIRIGPSYTHWDSKARRPRPCQVGPCARLLGARPLGRWLTSEQRGELLVELPYLRVDHDHAVRVPEPVPLVVIDVVRLGRVKGLERRDLGHDPVLVVARGVDFADDLFGDLLLGLVVVEDGGAVLGPDVFALAVGRGRGVQLEEHLEQGPEGDDVRVEGNLDGLRVAGRAGADGLVGGIRYVATA